MADERYNNILRQVFQACDVEDYDVGVTTGEDADTRWITITISKTSGVPWEPNDPRLRCIGCKNEAAGGDTCPWHTGKYAQEEA